MGERELGREHVEALRVLTAPMPEVGALAAEAPADLVRIRLEAEGQSQALKRWLAAAPTGAMWGALGDRCRRVRQAIDAYAELLRRVATAQVAQKERRRQEARAREDARAESSARMRDASPWEFRAKSIERLRDRAGGDVLLALGEDGVVYRYDPVRGGWVALSMAVVPAQDPDDGAEVRPLTAQDLGADGEPSE